MFIYKKFILFFCLFNFLFYSFTSLAATSEEHAIKAQQNQEELKVIDINSATAEELMRLKGIGKKRANAVIADRKQNGRFNHIEELSRVKGIGKKRASQILSQNQGLIQIAK